jgi:hypothetical protein
MIKGGIHLTEIFTLERLGDLKISNRILNEFVQLFYVHSPKSMLKNPEKSMRNLLSTVKFISENYFMIRRWIFEIHNDTVENVFLSPIFSNHARERLHTRFATSGPKNISLVSIEIAKGRTLSKKERAKLKTGVDPGDKIVVFGNRLYVVRNNVLTTIMKV